MQYGKFISLRWIVQKLHYNHKNFDWFVKKKIRIVIISIFHTAKYKPLKQPAKDTYQRKERHENYEKENRSIFHDSHISCFGNQYYLGKSN